MFIIVYQEKKKLLRLQYDSLLLLTDIQTWFPIVLKKQEKSFNRNTKML